MCYLSPHCLKKPAAPAVTIYISVITGATKSLLAPPPPPEGSDVSSVGLGSGAVNSRRLGDKTGTCDLDYNQKGN